MEAQLGVGYWVRERDGAASDVGVSIRVSVSGSCCVEVGVFD